jgi:hypothetical protein
MTATRLTENLIPLFAAEFDALAEDVTWDLTTVLHPQHGLVVAVSVIAKGALLNTANLGTLAVPSPQSIDGAAAKHIVASLMEQIHQARSQQLREGAVGQPMVHGSEGMMADGSIMGSVGNGESPLRGV